jgi:hypothetical protein
MPPIAKRTARARTSYTVWHYWQLATGHDYFDDAFGRTPDPEALAEGWSDLGADVIILHSHRYPGTRPWGWWQFEAPEPRKLVKFGPTKSAKLKPLLQGRDLLYGLPAHSKGFPTDDFNVFLAWQEAFFETQGAYLVRLKLTTPEEDAGDFPYDARVQLMHAHEDDQPRLSLEQIERRFSRPENDSHFPPYLG